MRRISLWTSLIALGLGLAAVPSHLTSRPATSPDFVHFESPHVHPLAITPSRDRLLAVNTPDARLAVFDLGGTAPARIAEIPVGMEPVSVAALNDSTAWVVNFLSDDVSVVNLNTMHVRATLRVGDEPGDVVFAGSPLRAYVSVGGEDVVKVFDPNTLAQVASIPIEGRMPRALARNAAGTKVYAAVFMAGNETSVLSASEVPADSMPSDLDFPRDPGLPSPPPRVGLIVQRLSGSWYDMYGNLWNSKVKYSMHEVDVAEIQTGSNTISRRFGRIGSTNFGVAVNPVTGRIAVTTTKARNEQRFEPRLVGYLVETQMAFINDTTGSVAIRILDPQPPFDYSVVPGTQLEADSAIGIPTGVTFSDDGLRAYVTSFATNKIAVMNPFASGSASALRARVRTLPGPTGVVEDGARKRLYVLGRFHNQLQVLSTADFSQVAITNVGFDPTPDGIVNGRKFFYGGFTSGHGEQSCATCHVFGDHDGLAWDLGEPFGAFIPGTPPLHGFDPMKGPLMTQSLRGLPGTGVLHWRGDRVDLDAFNPAFVSLMGRASALPDSEMSAFSDFVLALAYPPNPNRYLDRTLRDAPPGTPSALRGEDFFFNTPVDSGQTCVSCHSADNFGPGTNGAMIPFERIFESQDLKVPQLRNLYTKTGFRDSAGVVNKRGFGFTKDGAVDRLTATLETPQFDFGPDPNAAAANRRDLEAYLLAFDTGMHPAVGAQVTFDGGANPAAIERLDTLTTQAALGRIDLIAKGRVNGQPRGWLYQAGLWKPDKAAELKLTTSELRALAGPGSEVTAMGVPAGSGERMGVDRDRDGYGDGDELDGGSDPGDPASVPPPPVAVGPGSTRGGFWLGPVRPNPFRSGAEIHFSLGYTSAVDLVVYDVLGREVRSLARGQRREAGPQAVRWDGRASDGRETGPGVYFVRVTTEAGAFSRPVVRIR